MYAFPPELRSAYESQPVPFAYYQYIEGKVVPLLVSDGLCRQVDKDRAQLMEFLSTGKYAGMHPDDAGRIARITIGFANRQNEYDVLFRSKRKDGYHSIHAVGRWQTMPDGTELAVLTYTDVTDSHDIIRRMSQEYDLFQRDSFYSDPVTGLPNINYLHEFAHEKVSQLCVQGKTPQLIYSDVNSMQFYNTQYGFARGDDLLRLIARAIGEQFPDALIVRGADDHFILIDAFESQEATAQKIIKTNETIKHEAFGNTTGIQTGVCVYDADMKTTEALDHAKNALKRIGSDLNKTCFFYSHAADHIYWNQRYIVENFDSALENGWIKIYYQGITRVETDKCAALEALARWVDPSRGIITPSEFIPVLEKHHLLYKLDLYIMEQVCREIPVRAAYNLPLIPVSINFAAQDFDYADIPSALNALYEKHDMGRYVDRSCFIVEITEQDMAQGTESFHKQLIKLRRDGFRLWLDDFGSGYSSLNVFSRFDIDLIKFDMELLRHLDDHNGANRKILTAMVKIARDLGIHTLVEGMETEEQRMFLREIDCELAQGFLFHRPGPLDAILYMIKKGFSPIPCETPEERRKYRDLIARPAR